MSNITIGALPLANAHSYPTTAGAIKLRIWFTGCVGTNFQDSMNNIVMCGNGSAFYLEVPVTLVGTTLNIPPYILPSTDDSSQLTVLAQARFYVNNAPREYLFQDWIITNTLGASITYDQLFDFNEIARTAPGSSEAQFLAAISSLVLSLISGVTQGNIFEEPFETPNGIRTAFTLSQVPIMGSLQQFQNKQLQEEGVDYTLTANVVTFTVAPLPGDWLFSVYNTTSGLVGNIVLASGSTEGLVRLSVPPVLPSDPIAVGDNDPRVHYRGLSTKALLPAIDTDGALIKVTDDVRGLWYMGANNTWSPITGVLSVREFGAKGDGATNDSAAISAALAALPSTGGTVFFPPGKYRIATAITYNAANKVVRLKGVGGASQLFIAVGAAATAFTFSSSAEMFTMEDLTIIGNQAVGTDALKVLDFVSDELVTLSRVNFYGLATLAASGAIVQSSGSLVLRDCLFAGCTGSSGINVSVVQVTGNWKLLHVDNCEFVDFGIFDGVFYSKTPFATAFAWVAVGPPTGTRGNMMGQNSIIVEHSKFDEGALQCFYASSDISSGDQAINSVTFRNNAVNLGSVGNKGVFTNGVDNLLVEACQFGLAINTSYMVWFANTTNVTVRKCWATTDTGNIVHDLEFTRPSYLTVEDCTFSNLVSQGGTNIRYKSPGTLGWAIKVLAAAVYTQAALDALITGAGLDILTDHSIRANRLFGLSATPGIAAGAAAGTAPTVSVVGNDVAGEITVTTGTATPTSGILATLTFSEAWATAPRVTLTPANQTAGEVMPVRLVAIWVTSTTTTFVVSISNVALLASTTHKWNYHCVG